MVKSTSILLSLAASAVAAPTCTWSSWKNVKNLFIFGDSYTQTGFDINGTQPNAANPFGNPPYPGWTSSNGPNWAGFLATTYNASFIRAYNLAYGGATVDSTLVTPYAPTVVSLAQQIEQQFLPRYGSHPTDAPWTSKDSLFAFFIGINDVGNSWWLGNSSLYDAIFTRYDGLLEQLYTFGARNYLFLNVPPVQLAPLTLSKDDGGYAVETEGKVIGDWNARVTKLSKAFKKRHADANLFVHDTYKVFDDVIKNPKAWEQTSGLKNVTGFCKAYANGTPTWTTKDPSCQYAVNEYLWLNDLHPTYPVHNATAASVAQFLKKQKC